MLKLYHTPGAVCAQKVRLGLEEKGQPWQSEIVDLGDLNPNGVVPTLVVDDQVLTESNVILEFADFKSVNAAAVEQAWPTISALARAA